MTHYYADHWLRPAPKPDKPWDAKSSCDDMPMPEWADLPMAERILAEVEIYGYSPSAGEEQDAPIACPSCGAQLRDRRDMSRAKARGGCPACRKRTRFACPSCRAKLPGRRELAMAENRGGCPTCKPLRRRAW